MNQRLKTDVELYSVVAHELKTPINVIYSTTQLIERQLQNGQNQVNLMDFKSQVQSIQKSCNRLTKLVDNTIDTYRIRTGNLPVFTRNVDVIHRIAAIVAAVRHFFSDGQVEIEFHPEESSIITGLDILLFDKALLNLISNAIKHNTNKPNIQIESLRKGDWLEIKVIDNGVGIQSENLELIFQHYQQLDRTLTRIAEGSGVGLALARDMVKLLGGSVSVTSEIGKGSIFIIALPIREVQEPDSAQRLYESKSVEEMIEIEFSDIYA